MKLTIFLFFSLIMFTDFLNASDASTIIEESSIQTSVAFTDIEEFSVPIPRASIDTKESLTLSPDAEADNEWYRNFWTVRNVYIAGLVLGAYVFRVKIGKVLMSLRAELKRFLN